MCSKDLVCEYLCRLKDRILLYSLFGHVPLQYDPYTKKLFLLKQLDRTISKNSISLSVLMLLELLEDVEYELLGLETLSNAMKHAYATSAVKWTVQQSSSNKSDLEYFEAVHNLWRGRIGRMESSGRGGLCSEELWSWKDEIEASVWEDGLRESLVKKSELINAFEAVRSYLGEEREKMKMGPSFSELLEERVIDDDDCEMPSCRNDSIPHSPRVNEVVGGLESMELQADAEEPLLDGRQMAKAMTSQCNASNAPQCNLVEQTCAANTYQWEESIDSSQEGSSNSGGKVEIPRLRPRLVSPQNKCESGSVKPRKIKQKWSSLEEETLRTAVEEYGEGNWKAILTAYKGVFQDRTAVNLKDKWRNLMRYKKT